jgi:hypothetical protein
LRVLIKRLVAWVVAVACFAGVVAATPLAAQAEDPSPGMVGGTFVPVTPARLYDWAGDNAKRATVSAPKTIQVLGVAGIPSSGVSAVVLDISAQSTAGITNVHVRTAAADATGPVLSVGEDHSIQSNTVIVEPSSAGTVAVATGAQPVGFNLDVQGYFTTESTQGQAGGFVPITPTRMVATNTGVGVPTGKFTAGTTYASLIAGNAEIPEDATAVFANVRIASTTVDGSFKVGAAGTNVAGMVTMINYEAGEFNDSGMTIPLGTGANAGKIDMWIGSGTADVLIDVQGYFTGTGESGGGFTPLTQYPIHDTRTTHGGDGPLGAGEEREIQIAGLQGVPDEGTAGSVALTIAAQNWTANGSASVFNADLEDSNGTSNISWYGAFTGEPEVSTSIVELSEDGTVTLKNNTTGYVHIILTAQGWFGPTADEFLTRHSPTAAFVPTITAATNETTLTSTADDPNDDLLRGRFRVWNRDSGVELGEYVSAYSPSAGGTFSVTLPTPVDGRYDVQVWADDGVYKSQDASPTRQFQVDSGVISVLQPTELESTDGGFSEEEIEDIAEDESMPRLSDAVVTFAEGTDDSLTVGVALDEMTDSEEIEAELVDALQQVKAENASSQPSPDAGIEETATQALLEVGTDGASFDTLVLQDDVTAESNSVHDPDTVSGPVSGALILPPRSTLSKATAGSIVLMPSALGPLSDDDCSGTWRPNYVIGNSGRSSVSKPRRFGTVRFKWTSSKRLKNLKCYSNATFEPDFTTYNYDDKHYYGKKITSWTTNMKRAYKDTQFGDSDDERVYTVGTSDVQKLKLNKEYRTYFRTKFGNSSTDKAKIFVQRGKRIPGFCHSTWCIFSQGTSQYIKAWDFNIPGTIRRDW